MFKKGLVTLVCLTVLSAVWAFATTQYSISTKINSLGTKLENGVYVPVVGGSVKTRIDGATSYIVANQTNGTMYTTVNTDKLVDVEIAAADGYKIASVTKTTAGVTTTLVGATDYTRAYTVDNVASDPKTQFIVVTFAADTQSQVVKKTWQLQATNNNGGGSITLTRANAAAAPYSTVGKPLVKNYIDTTPVTVTAAPAAGYFIDYVVVNGVKDNTDRHVASYEIATVDGTNRLNTFNVGYKKESIPVNVVNAANGGGIAPANPVADPYGVVRLIITPTGVNADGIPYNTVTGVTVSGGTLALTDRFGTPVATPLAAPFVGPLKATISNIKAPLTAVTVTATYGVKLGATASVQGCTNTCHVDASLVDAKPQVKAAGDDWAVSKHAAVIDCVGCHQTMPGPQVTGAKCATCHTAAATSKASSFHAVATGHNTGTCQRCHSGDGARNGAEIGWTGGYADVLSKVTYTAVTAGNGIGCNTCHNPHNGGLLSAKTIVAGELVDWNPNGNASTNDQYDVCTSCHTITNNAGALVGNYHDGGSMDVTRTLSDTHFDNPATGVGLTSNVVEGYVVRQNSANPCADCHNLHGDNLEIQEAWAGSAHAGKITKMKADAACAPALTWWNAKYPTNLATACTDTKTVVSGTRTTTTTVLAFFGKDAAGVAFYKTVGASDNAEGNAWTHYNWDKTQKADGTSDRGDCQRCHTSTGLANYLTSPATYNANNNDFSHLKDWSIKNGSAQNELLYCWGCHKDSQTGELRNPGAITEVYDPAVTVTYPNVGKSNVCMACHLGRETGEVVKASTGNFADLGFINSHYLAAGATIFSVSGYEFAGQTYATGGHTNVGKEDGAGPCVACHMTSAEGHSFEIVAKDATGAITAVESSTCAECHGTAMTAAKLNADKASFHTALEALKQALLAKGIEFKPAHPYFYVAGTSTAFKNWDAVYPGKGKDVMGAAFNYNLLDHDPGAYAHNRSYALKLIADSIDFLADGVVNGAGSFDIAGVPTNLLGTKPVKTSDTVLTAGTGVLGLMQVETATAKCSNCHDGKATEWATSVHANANGSPSGSSSCAACHAPNSEYAMSTERVAEGGSSERYAGTIGCAGCHTKGHEHVDALVACGSCHDYAGHHGTPTPSFADKVAASKHNNQDSHGLHSTSTKCQRCHSTEGFIANIAVTGDKSVMDTLTATNDQHVTAPNCAACHEPHTATLRQVPSWDPNGNGSADQFDLCTSCHSLTKPDGTLIASGNNGTASFYHNTAWYRTIATTHYDNPATTTVVEGYNVRAKGEKACFDCHGHELRTNTRYAANLDGSDVNHTATIHNQWALSAHAGGLLAAKLAAAAPTADDKTSAEVDAVMAAGAIDAPIGNAWVHYDWDNTSSRGDCQHCHTATGAANFLDAAAAGTVYDKAANNYSHLKDWTATTGSAQQEVLYCWGCHNDVETGALRATGAITLDYKVNGAATAIIPADGKSSACISCHAGRGNSDTLLGTATLDPAGAAISSPGTKSHYLAAATVINQNVTKAGYTFGLNYNNPSYYKHNTIGCADCHMSSANSHSFSVVEKSAEGAISKLVATNCATCHTGAHGTALIANAADAAAFLEEEAEGYHGALEALKAALAVRGINAVASYPYFTGSAAANQGVSGAMYNYSLLHHEPGAYAHNRVFAKRLIYDSIDWVDNYALDNSVVIPEENAHARAWFGADATGAANRP